MKKIFMFLTAVFFAALLTSCGMIDFSNADDSIAAPTVSFGAGDKTIFIAPAYEQGVYYVNVFRYEVSDGTEGATMVPDTLANIGQILPTEYYAKQSLMFIDYYTDNTKYYQYFVRYRKSDGYSYSKTTISFKGMGTGEKELTAVTPAAPVIVSYDSKAFVLTIEKALIDDGASHKLPETHDSAPGSEKYFDLMISIDNGVRSQLFPLSEVNLSSVDCYQIPLGSLVPSSFRGKELSITGFTGQEIFDPSKGAYDNKTPFYNIAWTKPITKIEIIVDNDPTPVEYFTVAPDVKEPDTLDFTGRK